MAGIFGAIISFCFASLAFAENKTLVVIFKDAPSSIEIAKISKIATIERLSPYRSKYFDRVYRVTADAAGLATVSKETSIEKVEEIIQIETQSLERNAQDPLYAEQWYLENNGFNVRYDITDIKSGHRQGVAGEDLGWAKVREKIATKFSRYVSVAIIDTGVDYEHTEIKDAILLNEAECDSGEIPLGGAKDDRDNNGYKGDCKGINLTSKNPIHVNRPLDEHGHGTHLAGLISAKSDNDLGIAGISDQIKILPIKAYLGKEKRVAISDRIAEAILYAVSRRVDVINLSLGYPIAYDASHIREAVSEAYRQGVIIVAAAGNNAHDVPVFPCAYQEVICVGASQNDGNIASFSNFGAHVDIFAPGDFILSTYPTTSVPSYSVRGYEILSGTSQASPLVAGIFALVKGLFPQESQAQILRRVLGARDTQKKIHLSRILSDTASSKEDVRLVFKDSSIIEVNAAGEFSLPVQFQNLGRKHLKVELKSKSEVANHELLDQKMSFSLSAEGNAQISLRGRIVAFDAPLKAQVRLTWNGSAGESGAEVNFFLARKIETSAIATRIPIENTDQVKFIATAGSLNQEYAGDVFISFERVVDVDGLLVKVWKRTPSSVSAIAHRQLTKLTGILGYYQTDVNGDGQTDLLVLGQFKDGEDLKLVIYYLAEDLRPLVTQDGSLVLDEDPLFDYRKVANPEVAKWQLRHHPTVGRLLLPALIETGYTPEIDLSLKERRARKKYKNQGPFKSHLFYLEPIEKNGAIALRSRIVDTEAFNQGLRAQLGLRFYDQAEPKFSLPNGDVIFNVGVLTRARPVRVRYDDAQKVFTSEMLSWKEAYSGYRPVRFSGDQAQTDRMAMMGLLSKSRAHIVVFKDLEMTQEEQSLVVEIPDESEYIIRPLLLAVDFSGYRVVIETGQNLFGFAFAVSGQLQATYQDRLARSTFYNDLLTQVTWPVLQANGTHQIYVDDTQINARFVWLKRFSKLHGFDSSVSMSYTLSKECRTLNPVRWPGERFSRIQALCQTPNGLELLSLPLAH